MNKKTILKRAMGAVLAVCLAIPETGMAKSAAAAVPEGTQLMNLTTEYQTDPIGIDGDGVRFGWNMRSNRIGARQVSYQIVVTDGKETVWDSGKVEDSRSTGIVCPNALADETQYHWTLTVWDEQGETHLADASFETGVTSLSEWNAAAFIRMNRSASAPIFRTEQPLGQAGILRARLYITALGVYEASVNGNRVGVYGEDGTLTYHHMNPGYGNGDVSLGYQTYDVTEFLSGQTSAAVSILAGTGWKNGMGSTESQPAVKAMLRITYTDGQKQDILTNTSDWKGTLRGGITANGIYYGEDFNAILANDLGDFTQAGYDDSAWVNVQTAPEEETAVSYGTSFQPVEARYVRLSVSEIGPAIMEDNENRLQIMELELLDGETNVALGATPTVSDTSLSIPQWNPSNLTDGNTGLDNDAGYSTAILGYGETTFRPASPITVQLDLQQQKSFSELKIYPRIRKTSISSGICPNYPKVYTLEVSDDGSIWRPVLEDFDQGVVWNDTLFQNMTMSETTYSGQIRAQTGLAGSFAEAYDQFPQSAYTYSGVKADSDYPGGEVQIDDSYSARDGENLFQDGLTLRAGQTLIVNMGQNLTAVPRIEFSGKAGAKATLHFAELLNDGSSVGSGATQADGPKGSIYQKSLRTARSAATYIFAGSGREIYQPKLSFFGYQYIQITADDDITIYSLCSKAISSVTRQTGSIVTNNETVNKLFSNIQYGQMSNYFTTPTDCNQRDERLSWTGDTQAFAQTAVYNFDSTAFLSEMLKIYRENTLIKGYVPAVADDLNGYFSNWATGWSDVMVVLPWVLYQQTGDESFLTENWDALTRYLDFLHGRERGADQAPAWGNQNFGDWLSFQGTSIEVMNDYYYGYVHQLMAKIAGIVGEKEKQNEYEAKFEAIKQKFLQTHVSFADGKLTIRSSVGNVGLQFMNWTDKKGVWEDNSQTSLLWMLKLGFYDSEDMKNAAVQLLLDNIKNESPDPESIRARYGKNTLAVGFLGSNIIAPILSDIGSPDVSYDLLLQDSQPSWLFEVLAGATTVWERWNSYTPGTGFGDSEMNSFNHYAYGSVAEWMYRYMAGICADEEQPGFRHIILQPTPDTGTAYNDQERIHSVDASYDSSLGTIRSSWDAADGAITSYSAEIPANTTASVYLPVKAEPAGSPLLPASGVTYEGTETRSGLLCAKFTLASGGYEFHVQEDGTLEVSWKEGWTDADLAGDVNEDKTVDTKDVLMALKAANHSIELTDPQKQRADMDGDQKVTLSDAVQILKKTLI